MDERPVVTCFLRNRAEILLLQRSSAVGSYEGKWGAVAGHAEGNPHAAARTEIQEETGLDPDDAVTLVRTGDAFPVPDQELGIRWLVTPFLFEAQQRSIDPNRMTTDWEWVPPTKIFRRDTVPDLWSSYDRVRPTPETISADRTHGASTLSLRALAVIRDEAGVATAEASDADRWDQLTSTASHLLEARPAMPVIRNRVNRVMAAASRERTAVALEESASEGIEAARTADEQAASAAAERINGKRVATLSHSGTVHLALEVGDPATVLVAESRPGREGVGVAERLADLDLEITLTTDAAFGYELSRWEADVLLVGADAIGPTGTVRNKAGTCAAARVATFEGITVVVAAAVDKIAPEELDRTAGALEERSEAELYDGAADITVSNPTFDVTPSAVIDDIVTEAGRLSADEVAERAVRHREWGNWHEDGNERSE